jgi:hypothetical protein
MQQDLTEAAFVLKEYSLGCSRIKLEDIACHRLNRRGLGTNKKHCKMLAEKMWGSAGKPGEGLQVWIYKRL